MGGRHCRLRGCGDFGFEIDDEGTEFLECAPRGEAETFVEIGGEGVELLGMRTGCCQLGFAFAAHAFEARSGTPTRRAS